MILHFLICKFLIEKVTFSLWLAPCCVGKGGGMMSGAHVKRIYALGQRFKLFCSEPPKLNFLTSGPPPKLYRKDWVSGRERVACRRHGS